MLLWRSKCCWLASLRAGWEDGWHLTGQQSIISAHGSPPVSNFRGKSKGGWKLCCLHFLLVVAFWQNELRGRKKAPLDLYSSASFQLLLSNKLQLSSHSQMSHSVSMAGDLTMEHAVFVTALTEKTNGSIHCSCTLSYEADCFSSLNYPVSLGEIHSRHDTSPGFSWAVCMVAPPWCSRYEHGLRSARREGSDVWHRAAVCSTVLPAVGLPKLLGALWGPGLPPTLLMIPKRGLSAWCLKA